MPLTWCQHGHPSPTKAAMMADEWTAFARLAPLDPRVDFEFMFDLAIAETQAAGLTVEDTKVRARIEAALGFYQAALRRTLLGDTGAVQNEVLGNMAESYMMLGDLDDAIATYQQTLRAGAGDLSTTYGLAVAYDRDEQGAKARELVRALGADQFDGFKEKIRRGDVFFVPLGEERYYLALAEEAFGDDDQAIIDWQAFIDSKAHPQFAARAKANRDALIEAQKHGKRAAGRGRDR
jgi:tetratricopeptide (TPR) repeat protein